MISIMMPAPGVPTPAWIPPVNDDLLQIAYASYRYSLLLDALVGMPYTIRQVEESDIQDNELTLQSAVSSVVSDFQAAYDLLTV